MAAPAQPLAVPLCGHPPPFLFLPSHCAWQKTSVPSQSLAEVDTFALGVWHRVEMRVARLFWVLNSLGLGVVPSFLSSWFAAG
ncbi:hypothetical protein E2C01_073669 [Portunus trituberculatus]|uniref:Uncharacterized protein n=1 Tax=Portunus trituberculatus TaxID=210409 RepID=A0A5B7IB79_PORTR|nr:hypothetical protein [Portunus trituberculatus]